MPPPSPTPGRAPTRWALLEPLLVVATTVAAYANTFAAPFHFDDLNAVLGNPALRDLGGLWPPTGPRWLGELTFALNLHLGGEDVLGFHAVNLLVHLGCALLVFRLAGTTLRTPALRDAGAGPLLRRFLPVGAALLFALHPLATEAVTYVVQRFASLATLLYLAAVVLYAEARLALEAGPGSRRRAVVLYGLAVVAAVGAMATKEISVTLPATLAGMELLLFPGRPRRLLLVLPFAAAALLVPLGQREVLSDLDRWSADAAAIPPGVYLLTQTFVVLRYLGLFALPVGQSFDHDVALARSPGDPRVLLALLVHLAVAGLATHALVAARRRHRAAGVLVFLGVGWLYVTLAVESSVLPLRDVMVEHRMYLPSVGAALALATLLLAAAERLPFPAAPGLRAAAALAVVAAPLGVATFARNRVYGDDVALWADAVAKGPAKARPHHLLGVAHLRRGDARAALPELLEAVRLEPRYPEALANLAYAQAELGNLRAALRTAEQAVRLAPDSAVAHNNLGTIHEQLGDLPAASREYRLALRLAPAMAEAAENLARVRTRLGAPGR
jgi:Flp pilus assembly protein TadD